MTETTIIFGMLTFLIIGVVALLVSGGDVTLVSPFMKIFSKKNSQKSSKLDNE